MDFGKLVNPLHKKFHNINQNKNCAQNYSTQVQGKVSNYI